MSLQYPEPCGTYAAPCTCCHVYTYAWGRACGSWETAVTLVLAVGENSHLLYSSFLSRSLHKANEFVLYYFLNSCSLLDDTLHGCIEIATMGVKFDGLLRPVVLAEYLSIGFIPPFLAYAISANVNKYDLRRNSAMPPMWACVLLICDAVLTVLLSRAVQFRSAHGSRTHFITSIIAAGRYKYGLLLFLIAASPAMLFIGAVSYAAGGDRHGGAWGFIACIASVLLLAVVVMDIRNKRDNAGTGDAGALISGQGSAATVEMSGTPSAAGAASVLAPTDTGKPADSQARQCSKACCTACCISFWQWFFLILYGIFLFGWGLEGALWASGQSKYLSNAPGELYNVPISATDSSLGTHKMHIKCEGTVDYSRPTFLFEAGGGSSGISFFLAQSLLTAAGRRSCWYDRSGYGWSEPTPLAEGRSAEDYAFRLSTLLLAAGVPSAARVILVGHSAGVELLQVWAYINPTRVAGYAAADGYPNYLRLLKLSQAYIDSDTQRVCAALQSARGFEPVALPRLIFTSSPFNPPDQTGAMHYTYTNGKNAFTQYNEFCKRGGPDNTDWLAAAARLQDPSAQPFDASNGLLWPRLPSGTPVLLLPAKDTVSKPDDPYYKQMLAYNATLSPGRSSVVVAPGSHAFPWMQGDWLAAQLLAYFP